MAETAEEEVKAILREAFGDSSSESDGESSQNRRRVRVADSIATRSSIFVDSRDVWEAIPEINGLWICRDFLPADQQSALLSALEKAQTLLDAEGYLGQHSHNQAMKFGDLPDWALQLSYSIREDLLMSGCFSDNGKESGIFPAQLLSREPLFNQFILNVYQPGEGICAHVDLMRFEDGIAIVSLESSCVMHFSSIKDEGAMKVPVLLNAGSVVVLWGDARYQWKHEINRNPGFQTWKGEELVQKRRVSVTLRRLCVK